MQSSIIGVQLGSLDEECPGLFVLVLLTVLFILLSHTCTGLSPPLMAVAQQQHTVSKTSCPWQWQSGDTQHPLTHWPQTQAPMGGASSAPDKLFLSLYICLLPSSRDQEPLLLFFSGHPLTNCNSEGPELCHWVWRGRTEGEVGAVSCSGQKSLITLIIKVQVPHCQDHLLCSQEMVLIYCYKMWMQSCLPQERFSFQWWQNIISTNIPSVMFGASPVSLRAPLPGMLPAPTQHCSPTLTITL